MAKKRKRRGFKTAAEQRAWIAKKIQEKHKQREKDFEESGVQAHTIACKTCFHRLSESCPGLKPSDGRLCPYWYSPGDKVVGTAYLEQEF